MPSEITNEQNHPFPDSSHDRPRLPLCLSCITRCFFEALLQRESSATYIFFMKRFFKLAGVPGPKQTASNQTSPPPVAPAHLGPLHNKTGLDPKYTVPPVPHPIPYQHLNILVSSKGLLLRPHIPGSSRTESYVRIGWGLAGTVELVENAASRDPELDWSKAAVVYGILGSLDLFTGM